MLLLRLLAVAHLGSATDGARQSWRTCCKYPLGQTGDQFYQSDELGPKECLIPLGVWFAACNRNLPGINFAKTTFWQICKEFASLHEYDFRNRGKNDAVNLLSLEAARQTGTTSTLMDMLEQIVKLFPNKRLSWNEFGNIVLMHNMCVRSNAKVKKWQRWRGCAKEPSCETAECQAIVVSHFRQMLDRVDLNSGDDAELARYFLSLTASQLPPPGDETMMTKITENRDELWTRFSQRIPLYPDRARETLDFQKQWGKHCLEAASNISRDLEKQPKMLALLKRLGQARVDVARKQGTPYPELVAKELRFKRPPETWITPIGERYHAAYGHALLEVSKDPANEGLFAVPNSSRFAWARKCGAVLSWTTVPWSDCKPIIKKKGSRALDSVLRNEPDALTYGVSNVGNDCLIVMNNIIMRPRIDGLLEDEKCVTPLGFPHDGSDMIWTMLPQNLHASSLATELIQSIVLKRLLASYYAELEYLKQAIDEGTQLAVLDRIGSIISDMVYYVSNVTPWISGTSTSVNLLHHAMWMRTSSVLVAILRGKSIKDAGSEDAALTALQMLEGSDVDKDGQLSFDEFSAEQADMYKETEQAAWEEFKAELQDDFRNTDKDKDGKLSFEEIKSITRMDGEEYAPEDDDGTDEVALGCLGIWRAHVILDVHGQVYHQAGAAFKRHLYEDLLDHPDVHSFDSFIRCILTSAGNLIRGDSKSEL